MNLQPIQEIDRRREIIRVIRGTSSNNSILLRDGNFRFAAGIDTIVKLAQASQMKPFKVGYRIKGGRLYPKLVIKPRSDRLLN